MNEALLHTMRSIATEYGGAIRDRVSALESADFVPADVVAAAYSPIGHNHDGSYSPLGHNHDASYASISHDHDLVYAAIGHTHTGVYSPVGHDHDASYAALAHSHGSFSSGSAGFAPASGGGTTNFLRADGSWAMPAIGGVSGDSVSVNGTAVTDVDLDDATPSAPANSVNVRWQKDSSTPNNVSANVPTGSSSTTVCVGNDARLSNARTPTAHASTHQDGGGDEVGTTTPSAKAIPQADGSGLLDAGWLPDAAAGTKGAVTPTTTGIAVVNAASQAAARTAIGCGSAAVESAYVPSDPLIGAGTAVATFQASYLKGAANGYGSLDASAQSPYSERPLTYVSSKMSGDTSITSANTWTTAASISLTAGTWVVTGQIKISKGSTGLWQCGARITDLTNHYASGESYQPSASNSGDSLTLCPAPIVLASTTTIYLQGVSTTTGCTIKAALLSNGTGNNATQINAVRIA